jgi:hypothetical protein
MYSSFPHACYVPCSSDLIILIFLGGEYKILSSSLYSFLLGSWKRIILEHSQDLEAGVRKHFGNWKWILPKSTAVWLSVSCDQAYMQFCSAQLTCEPSSGASIGLPANCLQVTRRGRCTHRVNPRYNRLMGGGVRFSDIGYNRVKWYARKCTIVYTANTGNGYRST